MGEAVRRSRTSALASRRPMDRAGSVREYLSFDLAGEIYAVELARIREIVSPPPITEVPRAPPAVIGVCSVRGLLVTVIDTRLRMRVERRPFSRLSRLLLANVDSGEVMGLLVDEVHQVIRLQEHQIELAQSVLGGDTSDHVRGIGRPEGKLIVLLGLSSLVSF
jgi:purine-binding chemotaxis protein CheW